AADTMKKISLELGGHAPLIVMEDADLDKAVEGIIASKFRNAGQTCVCTNRVYVQASVEKTVLEKLDAAVRKLRVGNGLEEGVDIVPLIDHPAIEKVEAHDKEAIEKGGYVTQDRDNLQAGHSYYYQTTIIANAKDSMLCMNKETFGPVVPVASFENEDEAIKRANT